MRYAHVRLNGRGQTPKAVAEYLPNNYKVVRVDQNGQGLVIAGEDDHGWTLDDYVIPRLGSGLIAATEVWPVFVSYRPGDNQVEVRMDAWAGDFNNPARGIVL